MPRRKKSDWDFPPEVRAIWRTAPNLKPCRPKFGNVGFYKFIEHIKKDKCAADCLSKAGWKLGKLKMHLTQLLPMYFDRSNAFETLWSFYLTVILGLLAFSGGGKQTTIAVAIFLTIGFLVFAVASFKALTVVTHQRCQLQRLIAAAAKADDEKAIAATIDSSTVGRVVAFHLLGDVLAIAGIWCFALKAIG